MSLSETSPRNLPHSVKDLHLKTIRASFPKEYVLLLEINRPKQLNALNNQFWSDLLLSFTTASFDPNVRSIILTNVVESKFFTAGLDLKEFSFDSVESDDVDPARIGYKFYNTCKDMQNCISSISKCPKPVIALIDGGCIGGGVDIITACDIRYATKASFISVKEVDIGLAADVGTLQRLPKIVGNIGWVKEISFTGRNVSSLEAHNYGLIQNIFDTRKDAFNHVLNLANEIASKSPVPIIGTKVALNYALDHPVEDSLNQVATWNMSMHNTKDMVKSITSLLQKGGTPPNYSKL